MPQPLVMFFGEPMRTRIQRQVFKSLLEEWRFHDWTPNLPGLFVSSIFCVLTEIIQCFFVDAETSQRLDETGCPRQAMYSLTGVFCCVRQRHVKKRSESGGHIQHE